MWQSWWSQLNGPHPIYIMNVTHLKFNSSPLQSYQNPKRKGSFSNCPLSGSFLNFGGGYTFWFCFPPKKWRIDFSSGFSPGASYEAIPHEAHLSIGGWWEWCHGSFRGGYKLTSCFLNEPWTFQPWLVRLCRGWNPTQLYGDYNKNHEIRIPINQPVFHGK